VRQAFRGKVLTAIGAPRASKGAARARGDQAYPEVELLYIEDGLLIVEGGSVASVGPFAAGKFEGPVRDMRPCVLLPGFIDAHIHYPQTRVTGSASGELLEWLVKTVFPEEMRFSDELYARTVAKEFVERMLSSGTTTCAAFGSSLPRATDVLFEELDGSGMRAIAGLTLMDQACPEALALPRAKAVEACSDLIARWHGRDDGRLSFAITPRFAPSCSRRLMEDAARLAADHGLFIQTHISESRAEDREALAAHPYASDYLDVYDKVGLITDRTLLAHVIHLSGSEWDRVAERGSRVVHCPDSNFFLGSGQMRMIEARSRGIPVALGTDVAAGRSFDMRRTMASAYDTAACYGQRASAGSVFALATLGGAEALGLEASIGSLEPGKDADFIAMRLPEYVEGLESVIAQVAFAGDLACVERAFVRGRMVFSRSL
jgi:guanine deaminase